MAENKRKIIDVISLILVCLEKELKAAGFSTKLYGNYRDERRLEINKWLLLMNLISYNTYRSLLSVKFSEFNTIPFKIEGDLDDPNFDPEKPIRMIVEALKQIKKLMKDLTSTSNWKMYLVSDGKNDQYPQFKLIHDSEDIQLVFREPRYCNSPRVEFYLYNVLDVFPTSLISDFIASHISDSSIMHGNWASDYYRELGYKNITGMKLKLNEIIQNQKPAKIVPRK